MKSPQISVVTPSYNQAEFIEGTIKSVKRQEHEIEHVVVDGGSTDGTLDVLRKYEDDYDLRWVSESDRGQTHAINKGIKMATGEWIGWLNSDDYYLPGASDALMTGLNHDPNAEVVYGDLLFVDGDGRELFRRYHTSPSLFVHRHWTLFTGNHCTFFRSDIFDRIGLLDDQYEFTMDAEFLARVLKANANTVHVPGIIAARRMHEETKTGQNQAAVRSELAEAIDSEDNFVPEKLLWALAVGIKLGTVIVDGVRPDTLAGPRWSVEALYHEIVRSFA